MAEPVFLPENRNQLPVAKRNGPRFHIESDWHMGSPVLWKDEEGMVIVTGNETAVDPHKFLRFTVFDVRRNEKLAVAKEDGTTCQLTEQRGKTVLHIRQGDFSVLSEGKKYRDMSETIWEQVLPTMKELAER